MAYISCNIDVTQAETKEDNSSLFFISSITMKITTRLIQYNDVASPLTTALLYRNSHYKDNTGPRLSHCLTFVKETPMPAWRWLYIELVLRICEILRHDGIPVWYSIDIPWNIHTKRQQIIAKREQCAYCLEYFITVAAGLELCPTLW